MGETIHDIKNSLTAIRTCAEILGYDGLSAGERQEFSQTLTKEIDRVLAITQDLLEFSYGRKEPLNLQLHLVKDFMAEILPIITFSFTSQQITIQTDLQYTGAFRVDLGKMKRVFMNIADNAREAMPKGGEFSISTRLEKNLILFEFTDSGCGISSELQTRMFDPLVTEGKPHGTGLGMAIVKKILDEHQAQISVQSVVSKGTTIRIALPVPK